MNIFVLTREINEYDQDGEYFVAAFKSRPEIRELSKLICFDGVDDRKIDLEACISDALKNKETLNLLEHIQRGGGRIKNENEWYHLREVALL